MGKANTCSRQRFAIALAATVAAIVVVSAAAAPAPVKFKTLGTPAGMLAANGSIWVAGHRGGYVYRLNPRTNRISAAINVGVALCLPPTAAAGSIWVSECFGETGVNQSYRIDVKTNRVVGTIKGAEPVFGAGSLWTGSITGVLRHDPRSGVTLATIDPKISASFSIGVAHGSLWVAGDTAVSRIDTNTNSVSAIIPLTGAKPSGNYPGGYLFGGYGVFAAGKVWVTNPAGLFEIDPTLNTAKLIPIHVRPLSSGGDIDIAAGNGSLWVRTSNSTVTRIDAATGHVTRTYPAPAAGGGGGVAVGFGSLWIANAGLDTVWREPIR